MIEFCIKNHEFCTKTHEFCIHNSGSFGFLRALRVLRVLKALKHERFSGIFGHKNEVLFQ